MIIGVASWIVGILGLGLGLTLFWIGRRGWRVDSHALCPKCNFDWFNLPETSLQCPECGGPADAQTRGKRIGNRRRRPVPFWSGLVIALTGALFLAVAMTTTLTNVNLSSYQPVTTLLWDIRSGNEASAKKAGIALLSRLQAGELSESQRDAVAEDFIERHEHLVGLILGNRDPNKTLLNASPAEVPWLLYCYKLFGLRADLGERFCNTLVWVDVTPDARMAQGDELILKMRPMGLFRPDPSHFHSVTSAKVEILPVDDRPPPPELHSPQLDPFNGETLLLIPDNSAWLSSFGVGVHRIDLRITLTNTLRDTQNQQQPIVGSVQFTRPVVVEVNARH